jgi:class 3 adenylate cyclase
MSRESRPVEQPRPVEPDEVDLLEKAARAQNHLPDQNPNPVMRLADDGHLLYANTASEPIRRALGVEVGGAFTPELMADLRRSAAERDRPQVEIETDGRTFALLSVPFPELGLVNLYGTDVTARKVVDKFPDANPHPVMRLNEEGTLLYANQASQPITTAMGVQVGQALPTDVAAEILRACRGDRGPVEFQAENRTYSLWPVRIPEFDFINLYATDITALKALDKFPDANPNPVLRLSPEGTLLYANPASELVRKGFGVEVSQDVPAEWLAKILGCLEPGARRTMEVETEGRLFELLVVRVFEFGFINLYGTDITAARAVEQANRENERLLLNILPPAIAERLRAGERVIADRFEEVTLLFADIVGFTQLSSGMAPTELVGVLNEVFSRFDELVDRYRLEKIKTIGDAYMVVGGLPPDQEGHCARVAEMALELSRKVEGLRMATGAPIELRIGVHTGPAVAGVIGVKKFIYDVWGDTVNIASRMQSLGVPGSIQVSQAVHDRLRDLFRFEPRGTIEVRGKGPMQTYFLVDRAPEVAVGPGQGTSAVMDP